jgi:hypothetical protein
MLITEVNRSEVKSQKDFEKAVGKRSGKSVLLRVKAREGTVFMSLPTSD